MYLLCCVVCSQSIHMVWGSRPFLSDGAELHLSHTCIWVPSTYLADSIHVTFLVVWGCFWQRDREREWSLLPIATERKNYKQACKTSLAFLSHNPKSMQEGKYQFSNLSILFSPFSATSLRKILLSYRNSLSLSLKEKGQCEKKNGARNLICPRTDSGRLWEPNWQSGWRIWTFTFCVMKWSNYTQQPGCLTSKYWCAVTSGYHNMFTLASPMISSKTVLWFPNI